MSYSCIVLPFPVSVNTMFVNNPRGGRWRSKRYKEWQDEAGYAMRKQGDQHKHLGPIKMTMRFGRPDRRKRDLMNFWKPVEDACVKFGLMEDDSQVVEAHAKWDSTIVGVMIEIETAEAV